MKANFLFALFLLVAAATTGCQDAAPAVDPPAVGPSTLAAPSAQPAEAATIRPAAADATIQPAVADTSRLLWWGRQAAAGVPATQPAASPRTVESSEPGTTASLPVER